MKSSIIGITLGLLIMGCSYIVDSNNPAESWMAEVHLQEGSERHWISVELNHKVHYEGYFGGPDSQVQPLASFQLDLSQNSRQLLIRCVPINGNARVHVAMLEIPDDSEEFSFISLTVSGNSIRLALQEDPFQYV
jgi:hypothetical protein